jgi:hypothetical protein
MTAPLSLQSLRWRTLKAHFGNAGTDGALPAVPTLIERWHRAVGTYAEEHDYRDLFESYLHQQTILDIAYAVVPHLASRLEELDPDRRREVLDDLAVVEAVRITPRDQVEEIVARMRETLAESLRELFIRNTRDRYPVLPPDLSPAYLSAIEKAKRIAGDDWGKARSEEPGAHHFRRHIRYLRQVGLSDDDIVYGIEALTRDDEHGGKLMYEDAAPALEAMRRSTDAPAAWFERTQLQTDSQQGRLVFLAFYNLAWLSHDRDARTILDEPT